MPALDALMTRVEAARPLRLANAAFRRSADLNRFARIWLDALDARKAAAGLLDFDDLIDRARALLLQPGTAAWVLWRLDGGLDHILVDEAQDTSPAQWQVIQALSDEFFAGAGRPRRAAHHLRRRRREAVDLQLPGRRPGRVRRQARATTSRRSPTSAPSCSTATSCTPSAPPPRSCASSTPSSPASPARASPPGITHHADRPRPPRPRRALAVPEEARPARRDPLGRPPRRPRPRRPGRGPRPPHRRRDRRLARHAPAPSPAAGRAIRPGDVMILVQKRGDLFHAIIRELKRARVPVAGADLLRMGGELAVNDLLAALRVAATRGDDLSLAALLRSPLGGLSERDLFELAHPRDGQPLARAPRRSPPAAGPRCARSLADLAAQADYLRPYELLARILVRHDGRRRLTARLGPEAEDGIDALIDQALAYESVEAPSLTGFLAWFDREEVAVKRRTEETADQVRVMTVHGAKGLEAPIVILPDTAVRNDGANPPQILRLDGGQAVWKVPADRAPAGLRRRRERPPRPRPRGKPPPALRRPHPRQDLAHRLRRRRPGLRRLHQRRGAGTTSSARRMAAARPRPRARPRRRHPRPSPTTGPPPPPPAPAPRPRPTPPLPDWTRRPARVPATAAAPALALRPRRPPRPPRRAQLPSHRGGGEGPRHRHPPPARAPARPPRRRPRRPSPPASSPTPPTSPALLAEAAAVLDAPALAFLFAPGTLAEVDVTAPLAALGGARILGRIDRLVVDPARVLAVDFKSHQAVPATPGGRPRRHPPPDGRLPRRARADLARPPRSRPPSSGPAPPA